MLCMFWRKGLARESIRFVQAQLTQVHLVTKSIIVFIIVCSISVYCDGQHCTVAVHQACYGIVTVPTGPWFCRKCESQERSTRVRCELCPSKDGALKRTDNASWAHVVCALYIPEVRFGNVTTMEPIILQLIPQERFAKGKKCVLIQLIDKLAMKISNLIFFLAF